MAKSKLTKVSVEDSFNVGKIQGEIEAFREIVQLVIDGSNAATIGLYANARVRSLCTVSDLKSIPNNKRNVR